MERAEHLLLCERHLRFFLTSKVRVVLPVYSTVLHEILWIGWRWWGAVFDRLMLCRGIFALRLLVQRATEVSSLGPAGKLVTSDIQVDRKRRRFLKVADIFFCSLGYATNGWAYAIHQLWMRSSCGARGVIFTFCATIEMSGLATFSPEQVISSVGEVCVIAFTHRRRSFVCIQNLADDGSTLSVAMYDQPFCKAVQDLKV